MAEAGFFDFYHRLQSAATVPPAMLLFGFNDFLGDLIIRRVSRLVLAEGRNEFNYSRFYLDDDEETGWADVVQEARHASFFVQSRKLIVATIRSERRLGQGKGKEREELLRPLLDYLAAPNPHTTLILFISLLETTPDEFKELVNRKRGGKIGRLVDLLATPALQVVNLDSFRDSQIRQYVRDYLKERRVAVTAGAVEKLLDNRGQSTAAVIYQLPKLEAAAAGVQGIDVADVDELVTGISSHSIWELTDAIENENAPLYFNALNYLFLNGVKPPLIIGTLIRHYHNLFTAKFLLQRRFPPADIGKILGQSSVFLNSFIAQARDFSAWRLKEVLKLIYRLDYQSKTGGEDSARLMLQTFIFQVKQLKVRDRALMAGAEPGPA